MSLAADLVTILNGITPVTALCVTNTKTNSKAIRPDRLSQSDILSADKGGIEITTNAADFQNAMDGSSKTAIVKVTIAAVARGSIVANNLADAIWDGLEGYRGATAGGRIESVTFDDRREDWATLEDGTDTGEYVVELDLSVFYRRS